MRARWVKAAVVAVAITAAVPAAAQAGRRGNVLRTEIGAGQLSTGYYCAQDFLGNRICDWSPWGHGVFVLGASYDTPIGRTANLTVGGRLLAGGSYGWGYSAATFLEPVVGVTWKFPLAQSPVELRAHTGLGLYLGSAFGAALRLGGGLAVNLSPAVDLGFDLLLEVGALGGYGNTTFSFTLGPEFRL